MPTYEYLCRSCGERLEAVQGFHDEPLTTCPACGGELRKVFGSVGIVFKGSGFYKTDSRSTGTGTRPASTSGTDPAVAPTPTSETTKTSEAPAPATPAPAQSVTAPAANAPVSS
jgi:putative FmdB family regulatory protein